MGGTSGKKTRRQQKSHRALMELIDTHYTMPFVAARWWRDDLMFDGADQFIGPTQRVINTKQIPVTVHTQLIILNANRSNFLVKFV